MTDPPCRDCIPRSCAEAFADIRQTLGHIATVAEATHVQATRTNGRVAELFAVGSDHRSQLTRLETELDHLRLRQVAQDTLARRALTAGWRLAVMLAGVVASLLGFKHLIR